MPKGTRSKLILCINIAAVIMVLSSVFLILYSRAGLQAQYNQTVTLYQQGNYEIALADFDALGDYRDCILYAARIRTELDYQKASELLSNGNYDGAVSKFRALGNQG